MHSINLLPENFEIKKKKKKSESRAFSYVSLFLLISSIITTTALYANNYFASQKNEALSLEMEKTNEELKKEINNSKLLKAESSADDINAALERHAYFTKVMELVRRNMASGVELDSFSIKLDGKDGLISEFEANTKDYLSAVMQVNFFRKISSVESVSIKSIDMNKEGSTMLVGTIKWKPDVIYYKKQPVSDSSSS